MLSAARFFAHKSVFLLSRPALLAALVSQASPIAGWTEPLPISNMARFIASSSAPNPPMQPIDRYLQLRDMRTTHPDEYHRCASRPQTDVRAGRYRSDCIAWSPLFGG